MHSDLFTVLKSWILINQNLKKLDGRISVPKTFFQGLYKFQKVFFSSMAQYDIIKDPILDRIYMAESDF